jgi:hypothetical protein
MKHGLVSELGSNFRQLRSSLEIFTMPECEIRHRDKDRVEQKRTVAMRVANLIGLV